MTAPQSYIEREADDPSQIGQRPVTALRRHRALARIWESRRGFRGLLTTVNNNDLGLMYLVCATAFFLIAGVLAMLIRAQLATPHSPFMGPDVYNQIFTMHGTIMMFLFAIPFFEGLTIYLLPKMLGTRDLAYPRLSAYGFWCFLFGGSILIVAMVLGVAPESGWFMYPPLSSTLGSPGINSDIWLLGITFDEISAITAAVEIVVTILRYRAAGMSLDKLPVFAWYMLVVAVMILTGFPPMILGSILLELERAFGLPFFQAAEGGDSLLWQHLFWLFGHPEVYIIFLPAAGVISTILPVMARTTLLGYGWVVAAAAALGVISFGLWVHHMYTVGIPHMGMAFFSAASTLVAVPMAIQIFAWIGTIWKGRPQLHLPMLWIIGFFLTFVIGGLTGVMIAMVPFNWQVHDTHFIVAHFHYVLVGGYVFPMLAAVYYWLPNFTGRQRFFRLGHTAFWLLVPGFHVTFLAMHWAGLLGQRRRTESYDPGQGWELINLVASIGGFAMAIGFGLVIVDVIVNAVVATRGRRNPWNAGTMEWAMSTPSPAYNVASIPVVRSRDPLHDDPDLAVRIARGEGFLGDPVRNRREILAVRVSSGQPDQVVVFPGNSTLPIILAAVTGSFFLAMLFKVYWVLPLSILGTIALAWRWAWGLGARRDEGLLDIGHGVALPSAAEAPDLPGWWGTLFLLLANSVFFGSLLFGYAFLWTVAPNWPPPAYLEPGALAMTLAVGGVIAAPLAVRLAQTRLRRGGSPHIGLAASGAALIALIAAALLVLFGLPEPQKHAYDATVWVLAGYVMFHATVVAIMTLFVMARAVRGYLSVRRAGELRVLRLWTDYAALVALLALTAVWLPGLLT